MMLDCIFPDNDTCKTLVVDYVDDLHITVCRPIQFLEWQQLRKRAQIMLRAEGVKGGL